MVKQTTRITKTHKGYSGHNDQPLKSHEGLDKVERPWKVQGLLEASNRSNLTLYSKNVESTRVTRRKIILIPCIRNENLCIKKPDCEVL